MLTINATIQKKQAKRADPAAQTFDSLPHFQVLVKEELSKKTHKYMCNQIKKHNSALYFGLQAFFQLPLPFYLFLYFCTQCVGQHAERIPCTAIMSQPTLSNTVSTPTRGHQPHKLWQHRSA